MRGAGSGLASRSTRAALTLAMLLAAALGSTACARRDAPVTDMRVAFAIEPEQPRVGPVTVELRLSNAAGVAVAGARVRVEGNMSHPGMAPSIADAREVAPGTYRAALEFGMAGDWVVDIQATLADGRKVEREFAVLGVQPR